MSIFSLKGTQQAEFSQEDFLWSGLSFQLASEEELAHGQSEVNEKIHFHRGVWWRQIKYSFYEACVPFQRVDHQKSWPHPLRALAGFTHIAAPNSPSNGVYQAVVREDVSSYSIKSLSTDRRTKLRKALSQLTVRVVDRCDDLLADGYEVYVSWHERVRWGRDKTNRKAYNTWISGVYRRPKHMVLGAYKGDKLVAFMLPFVTGEVAVQAYLASHTDFLKYRPNEAIIHAFLCLARQTPGVKMAYFGPVCSKSSLNDFKLNFASVKRFPSYTWISPVLRPVVGQWFFRRYPWLGGSTAGILEAEVGTKASDISTS
jgi:hypothetical protein